MTEETRQQENLTERVNTIKDSFSIEVEVLAKEEEITLLEAMATLATQYGINDKINNYISRPLKEKLEIEVTANRLIKSTPKASSVFDI